MAHQPQTDVVDVQILTALVLRHLKRFGAENEIIARLCRQTDDVWDWDQAQAFYRQVAAQYQDELTLYKARLLLSVSAITLVGGLVILAVTILSVAAGIATLNAALSGQIHLGAMDAYGLAQWPGFIAKLLDSGLGYQIVLVIVSGFGMLGGGTIGIIQTIRQVQQARKRLQSQTASVMP